MGGCYGLGVSDILVFLRTVKNGENNELYEGGEMGGCRGGMRTRQRHGGVRLPKNKP